MAIETTYSQAREQLASLMDRVTDDLEVVIISRPGGKRVALIDAAEYEGLLETARLLLNKFLIEERRAEISSQHQRSLEELGRGDLEFSTDPARLRQMLGKGTTSLANTALREGLEHLAGGTPQAEGGPKESGRISYTHPVSLGGCLLESLDNTASVLAASEGEDFK